MNSDTAFSEYARKLRAFIQKGSVSEFNTLALELFALQYENNKPYRQFCVHRAISPPNLSSWSEIPAMPAEAFKEFELTSLPVKGRATVFHSSGTMVQPPSRHFHDALSLAIYKASLLPWFQVHLLPDWDEAIPQRPIFISLTPAPLLALHSSLVYMFDTICRNFNSPDSLFAGQIEGTSGLWTLNVGTALAAMRRGLAEERLIILLGTAFNFVHLLEAMAAGGLQLALPAGSRVLETGGYKGRSRTVPRDELYGLIHHQLGIPPTHIISEYGMCELSSQAYNCTVPFNGAPPSPQRTFQFPPWARVMLISPETGREVLEGEVGLIWVIDLANVRSVLAVQTADMGIRRGAGFDLLGRAKQAEPRGCSLVAN